MPENLVAVNSTFHQRRHDIFKRLQQCAEQCKLNYNGRKELASEKDETVAELCDALFDTFTYGLRQPHANVVVTAASIFQNMQEIVTGHSSNNSNGSNSNEITFWDFCRTHLTVHEHERYENLKQVWTKNGRGKAFIRASLNENSLQRYLLTWLNDEDALQRFYTPWSLLLDAEMAKHLPEIVGNLNGILFALTVDTTELNAATRAAATTTVKEEPIIYAPTPMPVASTKSKRRPNVIERPIVTANSTEDLLKSLHQSQITQQLQKLVDDNVVSVLDVEEMPPQRTPDPIEPELEFLKQPLPDFYPENQTVLAVVNERATVSKAAEQDYEDKSDSSSQYSKSSSANYSANQAALEKQLQQMSERCALLETRVAQLSLENRQMVRRLTQHFNEKGINPNASLATNFLITIPNVQLLKTKGGSAYYAYDIHITMRQHLEHWSLVRRYRDFYKLHKSLLRTHPSVSAVEFPPKKHFGNMNLVFVEERRQQLQIYLLNLVETLPQVEACKSKAELQKVFPFLRER